MIPSGFAPAEVLDQRFSVAFEYPVVFCREAFAVSDATLAWAVARREPARRHPLFAIVDAGLDACRPDLSGKIVGYARAFGEGVELRAEPLVVPGGEAAKNDPGLVDVLHRAFAATRLDRHAIVLAVGGGAFLDLVGFAAATAHRGIRLVRMPSTVLAQNDGGVGVKNGVNAFGAKNFVGTFAPPHAVVNDTALLRTLPLRDARAGMAEAVKVALIRDAAFFVWLEQRAAALSRAEAEPLETLVRRAAAIHLAHIRDGGDPFEMGSARPLDYGHWAAHRLEIATAHELRHGEAVAIGMLLDARYAELAGLLSSEHRARIEALLGALGLPRYHPALAEKRDGKPAILAGLEEFREHLGGALTVTLLAGIGHTRDVSVMDPELVADAIAWLAERGAG